MDQAFGKDLIFFYLKDFSILKNRIQNSFDSLLYSSIAKLTSQILVKQIII